MLNQIGDWMLESIASLRDVTFRIAVVPRQVLARRFGYQSQVRHEAECVRVAYY